MGLKWSQVIMVTLTSAIKIRPIMGLKFLQKADKENTFATLKSDL